MQLTADSIFVRPVSGASVTEQVTSAAGVRRDAGLPLPWATRLAFLLTDLLAFSLLIALAMAAGPHAGYVLSVEQLMPILGLVMVAHAVSGLYYPIALHPAQELRSVAVAMTVVFAVYTFALVLLNSGTVNVLSELFLTWLVALVILLLVRALARVVLPRASWWGAPVVVLASNGTGEAVVETLERWPEIGLRPAALLHDEIEDEEFEGGPGTGMTRLAPLLATTHKIPYAIIAMSDLDDRRLIDLVGRSSKFFQQVLVVPDVSFLCAMWTSRQAFSGLLGYGVQHAAWSGAGRIAKRVVDVLGAVFGIIVLSPLLLLVAVLIKLDSEGPVFYRQTRMGRKGRCFQVLKFRSMHVDADRKLRDVLARFPSLRAEYERYHKLRDDPRITRVGKLLRRTSIDELPQLWNVLKGEMSLVGPRAYMPGELSAMLGYNRVILENRPGITGLWQVSGRNALSFRERVHLDVHYVQNWTPWLDIYILARTLLVVSTAEGAS